jgi:lipid-A-disaccharide synthase-like uncharacterized protein
MLEAQSWLALSILGQAGALPLITKRTGLSAKVRLAWAACLVGLVAGLCYALLNRDWVFFCGQLSAGLIYARAFLATCWPGPDRAES